jgi:hypothetical protein
MLDQLVVFAASPNRKILPHRPYCTFKYLYRPHILDNIESWNVFPNDESIGAFIQNEPLKPKEIIPIEYDKIPKGLTPLESSFSSSDVGNKEKQKEEDLKRKVGETISFDIRVPEALKNVKIGAQCSNEEEMKFAKILGEFQDVFSWSYEDLHGFDPGLIQHVIPIKEGIKPVRQKQIPIDSAFKTTIQRELEDFLKDWIIFPIKYPKWVSKLVLVPKATNHIISCINFRTFNQAIMKNPFPPRNLEMILQ